MSHDHDHDHDDPKGATHTLLVRSFRFEGGEAQLCVENPGPAPVDASMWLLIIYFDLHASEVDFKLKIRVPRLPVDERADITVSLHELENSGITLVSQTALAVSTPRDLASEPGGQGGPGNGGAQPLVTIIGPVF